MCNMGQLGVCPGMQPATGFRMVQGAKLVWKVKCSMRVANMQLALCPTLLALLQFNGSAGRTLLTLPPTSLEQLCKKLPGLWRGGQQSPAALYPVSLRACQLGDAVYVYCSLSAQFASCLDILCSYIGVVRSVWAIQSHYRLRNVNGVSRRSDYCRYRKALLSLSTPACGPRSRF